MPQGVNSSLPQDETLPLLPELHDVEQSAQHPLTPAATPLPKAQLATLCLIRLVDPIAYCQIFPYINEFLSYLHVTDDPSKIGFYSGLVESSFAIAQLCSIYQWTSLSNTIGRRPVIMMGTLGIALTTVYFGLSTSLSQIILSRCLAGIFGGTVAVVHSVLAEITDSTNQSIAFPIYGLFWPLGSILGPLLGGSLSNPADRYPALFSDTVFAQYPYLLPCVIAGCLSLSGVVLAYTCLKETLPPKEAPCDKAGAPPTQKLNVKAILSIPFIRALSISSFALSFNGTAFDVLFVLFCYSPVQSGGLGFSASQIGFSLAAAGTTSVIMQLVFMPTVLKKYKLASIYNFCISVWPATFAVMPFLNVIARAGLTSGNEVDPAVESILWMGIIVTLALSRLACLAYSVNMILIKENAPDPMVLASVNGLVQCFMCLSRAISPTVVSCVFAFSEEHRLLGGYFWALFMIMSCLGGCTLGRRIMEGNPTTKITGASTENDYGACSMH